MLRLEKTKQLDRLPDSERKILIAEIRSSRKALDLVKQVIEDKIRHYQDSLITDVGDSIKLGSSVMMIHELKNICKLFDQTEE